MSEMVRVHYAIRSAVARQLLLHYEYNAKPEEIKKLNALGHQISEAKQQIRNAERELRGLIIFKPGPVEGM